ncbi:MAG: Unknown protein [uncultured Campylobacterales bacterium]|uniref:Periplasmic protein n=1 Tax=uncultured Campylobacterales bacterium TaxID=352960 RepID=A0A6S6SWS9_9BACT|nr:MAG: Unknown protein [uncultured Campylobacterales bacterium]
MKKSALILSLLLSSSAFANHHQSNDERNALVNYGKKVVKPKDTKCKKNKPCNTKVKIKISDKRPVHHRDFGHKINRGNTNSHYNTPYGYKQKKYKSQLLKNVYKLDLTYKQKRQIKQITKQYNMKQKPKRAFKRNGFDRKEFIKFGKTRVIRKANMIEEIYDVLNMRQERKLYRLINR